ncbi:hypothetical protein T439DRAFT_323014 [Meredithblackwellia eburnea MCA 4105]
MSGNGKRKPILAEHEFELDTPDDFTSRELQLVDSSLRCPICGEHFCAPNIISTCGHTFCSKCIRQTFAHNNQPRCPSCSKEADEGKLKPNTSLDQVVKAWVDARSTLLNLQSFINAPPPPVASTSTSTSAAPTSRKRHRESTLRRGQSSDAIDVSTSSEDEAPTQRSTRSRTRNSTGPSTSTSTSSAVAKGKRKKVEPQPASSDVEIIDDNHSIESRAGPSSSVSAKKVKRGNGSLQASASKIECPICGEKFADSEIENHASRCDGTTAEQRKKKGWGGLMTIQAADKGKGKGKQVPVSSAFGGLKKEKSQSPSLEEKTKRLAARNYEAMKQSQLLEFLKAESLPIILPPSATSTESKLFTFRRRAKKWTVLWNSNCDLDPNDSRFKSRKQLVKELTEWEKVMDKSVDNDIGNTKAYDTANTADFKTLIRQGREAKRLADAKAAEAKSKEAEVPLISSTLQSPENNSMPEAELEILAPDSDPTSALPPLGSPPGNVTVLLPISIPEVLVPPSSSQPPAADPEAEDGDLSASDNESNASFDLHLKSNDAGSKGVHSQANHRHPLSRRHEREESPFDPEGPRPSQMTREDFEDERDGWYPRNKEMERDEGESSESDFVDGVTVGSILGGLGTVDEMDEESELE